MSDNPLIANVETLAGEIPDGAQIVLPRDHSGTPMEIVRALIRRQARDLRLITLTSAGMSADLLIGAGCVAEIETPGVSLGEFGPAPRFTNAIKNGLIKIKDSTCPAIHARLQAGEKGVPFMPLRGIIGSDLLKVRPDWKVIDNPFGDGDDPIVLLPAAKPDAAILHASMADDHGNVWVGRRLELKTAAHAARESFVTVERFYEGNMIEDDRYAAGVIPALYIGRIAQAEHGAWPMAFWDKYGRDSDHLREYAKLARSDDGFQEYLAAHVLGEKVAA
jgi:glutaconate CoA-transferase subunit A